MAPTFKIPINQSGSKKLRIKRQSSTPSYTPLLVGLALLALAVAIYYANSSEVFCASDFTNTEVMFYQRENLDCNEAVSQGMPRI